MKGRIEEFETAIIFKFCIKLVSGCPKNKLAMLFRHILLFLQ